MSALIIIFPRFRQCLRRNQERFDAQYDRDTLTQLANIHGGWSELQRIREANRQKQIDEILESSRAV